MAVTVTDTRTVPTNGGNTADGDATGGWTGTKSPALFTSVPSPVELSGCLGMVVSTTTEDAYFTMGSSQDWSAGMLVYIWMFSRGEPDTLVNGGFQIQIGDGTNRIGFHVGGSDIAGFRHDDGPVGWQCFVIDTAALPTDATVYGGSLASLDLTAITTVGIAFKTLAKALGNLENMFWDIVRYGNDGLIITGGTGVDPGTFDEIVTEDKSGTSGKAHGIIRKYADGTFGLQGPLTFGDDAGTSAHVFRDTNKVVVFEDRGFTRDKYYINVVGNSTGAGEFSLGTKTGSGITASGIDGCTLSAPDSAPASIDASDADMDECNFYGCTISGFANGIILSDDATLGPDHEFHGNTVKGCGITDLGRVVCRNNLFTGTKAFDIALAAGIQDDGGAFTDETTDINSAATADVDIYPATPVNDDAFYFGHIANFTELKVLVTTASTTGTIIWEYYNGASYATLTLTSQHTDFSRTGVRIFTWAIPGDWATDTVNSQGPFYYIRARYSTAGTTVVASQGFLFGPADMSAVLWNANIDLEYSSFTENTDADNDPSGIEFPIVSTEPLVGLTYSGNDFDAYNTSGGLVTLEISGDGDTPSVRNTSGSSTVIVNTKTVRITVIAASDFSVITGARVLLETEDNSGDLPWRESLTLTSTGTTATAAHTSHGMPSGTKVKIQGANESAYNGIFVISNVSANAYDYTMGSDPVDTATGTIVATAVLLDGTTNGSGVIEDTGFAFTNDQPVGGRVRKNTASPRYKTSPISDTVDDTGFDLTVFMIDDE